MEYAKDACLILSISNIASKLMDKETAPKYYFIDNGILNLFLLDAEAALLENLVAITLLRKYGRENAVFFYNKGIEVDFYIPKTTTAIQVCYRLNQDGHTFDRETSALVKLSKVIECNQLTIITRDEERTLEISGITIEVIPIWKWLMQIV